MQKLKGSKGHSPVTIRWIYVSWTIVFSILYMQSVNVHAVNDGGILCEGYGHEIDDTCPIGMYCDARTSGTCLDCGLCHLLQVVSSVFINKCQCQGEGPHNTKFCEIKPDDHSPIIKNISDLEMYRLERHEDIYNGIHNLDCATPSPTSTHQLSTQQTFTTIGPTLSTLGDETSSAGNLTKDGSKDNDHTDTDVDSTPISIPFFLGMGIVVVIVIVIVTGATFGIISYCKRKERTPSTDVEEAPASSQSALVPGHQASPLLLPDGAQVTNTDAEIDPLLARDTSTNSSRSDTASGTSSETPNNASTNTVNETDETDSIPLTDINGRSREDFKDCKLSVTTWAGLKPLLMTLLEDEPFRESFVNKIFARADGTTGHDTTVQRICSIGPNNKLVEAIEDGMNTFNINTYRNMAEVLYSLEPPDAEFAANVAKIIDHLRITQQNVTDC